MSQELSPSAKESTWPFDPNPAGMGAPLSAADRWHELLSSRYVCEACLTRYFMKYRTCKACGAVGRIRMLTASLFDLADSDGELREMISNGQRILFTEEAPVAEEPSQPVQGAKAPEGDYEI